MITLERILAEITQIVFSYYKTTISVGHWKILDETLKESA